VDIELELPDKNRWKLIRLAKKKKVGVICSHHDFDSTPSVRQILEMAERISGSGADIAKLVFMPSSNRETSRILDAANVLGDGNKMFTVFGMGVKGQITRLASLIFGSCLIYCSLGRSDKKLGQIGVGYAKKYIDSLQFYGWPKIREDRTQLLSILQRELRSAEMIPLDMRFLFVYK